MAFQFGILFTADSDQAQAGVAAVESRIQKARREIEAAGRSGRTAAGGLRETGEGARRAAAGMDEAAAAARRTDAAVDALGQTNTLAAGQVGNLAAQFNDIGIMLAAGQNPLQLALQQGTQITQVIGPMGAAGAARALGQALLAMISPVSLLTIGLIAGGAAAFQWASGFLAAGEEAEEFEDKVERLEAAVATLRSAADTAAAPGTEILARFRGLSDEARDVSRYLAEFARIDAVQELDGAVGALTERFGGLSRTLFVQEVFGGVVVGMFTELERTVATLGDELDLTSEQAEAVVMSLEALANAGSVEEKAIAAAALQRNFEAAFGSIDKIPVPLMAAAREAGILALLAADIAAATEDAGRAAARTQEEWRALADVGANQQRVALMREVAEAEAAYGRQRATNAARDQRSAEALLADLQRQIALQVTINAHGEESAEVTRLRQHQEREVFEEMLRTLDVSEDLKLKLMDAFRAVQLIESSSPWAPIAQAANEAARLSGNLATALASLNAFRAGAATAFNAAMIDARLRTEFAGDPVGLAAERARADANAQTGAAAYELIRSGNYGMLGTLAGEGDQAAARGRALAEAQAAAAAAEAAARDAAGGSSGSPRGGSGRSAIEAETRAIDDLIRSLEDELAVLRETDPVAQEMLRLREQLTGATEAERGQVEELIAARLREQEALDAARERAEYWRDTMWSALEGLTDRSRTAGEVMRDLLSSIARVVLEGAAMGRGPLAGIFGGPSLADAILGPLPGKALGGMIYGPGGGTDDKVMIAASAGEYVVNARSTARYRHLLEAINTGSPVAAFAAGGAVGGGSAEAMPRGRPALALSIDLRGVHGDRAVEEAVARGVQAGLEAYDREVLPLSVGRISRDPARIG